MILPPVRPLVWGEPVRRDVYYWKEPSGLRNEVSQMKARDETVWGNQGEMPARWQNLLAGDGEPQATGDAGRLSRVGSSVWGRARARALWEKRGKASSEE